MATPRYATACNWNRRRSYSLPRAHCKDVALLYDDRGLIFEIESQNGRIYRYKPVPKPIYRALMAAESKDGFSTH
jgi:hypothetical protein